MSVDLRDSVEKWKTHFWEMAQGKIPVESLYFFNQRGQGLGTNPKGCALYKIQTEGQSLSSPINKGYAIAVGRIKDIEKRKTKKKNIKEATFFLSSKRYKKNRHKWKNQKGC